MNPAESLLKAISAHADAADPGLGAMETQLGSPSADVHLTDAEREFIIDTVVDQSVLLGEVRKVQMRRSLVEIPKLAIGTRLMRATKSGGTPESTAPGASADVIFGSIKLQSAKTSLPWTLTEEFLEDNPEMGGAEAKIAKMMGVQAGNDLEDLCINGDVTSADTLLWANDGFWKLSAGGNVADFAGGNFTRNTFNQMVRALPPKYRRNLRQLRFYVGPNLWQDWVDSVAARQGNMADQYLAGLVADPTYGGIPIRGIPLVDEEITAASRGLGGADNLTDIMLTHPDNLIFGVQRDMKLRKTTEGKDAIEQDERYYVLHLRTDFQVQNLEAVVLGQNIRPRIQS